MMSRKNGDEDGISEDADAKRRAAEDRLVDELSKAVEDGIEMLNRKLFGDAGPGPAAGPGGDQDPASRLSAELGAAKRKIAELEEELERLRPGGAA